MLDVHDVSVRYGSVRALEHVSLTLARGRIAGLIGMNGSGKSTLFKAIMGLLPLDTGRVLIDGEPAHIARRDSLVGYVPQEEAIDRDFPISVHNVVMTGRYGTMGFFRHPRAADRAAVADALERTGMTDLANRQIGQLSGGQRKRAFVARAIAQGAQLLLLDEPFAGVDKTSEAAISRLLRELSDDGCTILISSHDIKSLSALAPESVLLNKTIIANGPTDGILTPENLAQAFATNVNTSAEIMR